ncbi:MAG: NUDIX domain-containing protein [Anaerolineae bacterium]|jgi:8-oxo-dGTP diphosphatase|nr:NUDIX domain-containing protein [Anaerolineae bacterium]
MAEPETFPKRLSRFLRRYPWLIRLAYPLHVARQPRFTVGVVGVVFNAQREVLLVEHVYHPEIPWGLPGGGINYREDPALGLAREFREELGLAVRVVQPLYVEYTYWQHVDLAFLCRAEGEIAKLSGELTDARWFKRDALPIITRFQFRALNKAYETPETVL